MKAAPPPARVPVACRLPKGWCAALRAAGLAPRAVLAAAAIPAMRLHAQRERLSIAGHFRFWEALATVSGDPLVGLALGAAADPAPREPLFLAMRCQRHRRRCAGAGCTLQPAVVSRSARRDAGRRKSWSTQSSRSC